jgi:hypothetical protein
VRQLQAQLQCGLGTEQRSSAFERAQRIELVLPLRRKQSLDGMNNQLLGSSTFGGVVVAQGVVVAREHR